MKVAVGADHRGYSAKERVKSLLQSMGHEVVDCGTDSQNSCDYPDTAFAACKAVLDGAAESAILFCGTGIGMSISANKVPGIRAALCHDEMTAELARRHNDANALCIPADLIGEELTRRMVDAWVRTRFEGARHDRRVQKITDFERQSCKETSPTTRGDGTCGG